MCDPYKLTRLIIILWIAGLGVACNDYSIGLPNGYSLVKLAGENRVITDRKKRMVTNHLTDGTIVEYAVCKQYVMGLVSPLKQGIPQNEGAKYFLIDTINDQVSKGLDKESWEIELLKIGLKGIVLHRPSKLDVGKYRACEGHTTLLAPSSPRRAQ